MPEISRPLVNQLKELEEVHKDCQFKYQFDVGAFAASSL